MKPKVRSFRLKSGGLMTTYLVKTLTQSVLVLKDHVCYIGVDEVNHKEFFDRHIEIFPTEEVLQSRLASMAKYAMYAGMTAEAATYLSKLTPMDKEDIQMAVNKGRATVAKHKADGEAEEAKDVKAGKAPRKLAGAALVARQKKEERERQAAEALATQGVAAEVSNDLQQAEEAGASDVRLDTAAKGTNKRAAKAPKNEVEKVVKETAKAKKVAEIQPTANGDYKSASAMFKGLLLEDAKKAEGKRRSDEQIFKLVQAKFDLSDDKIGYVKWNRGKLKRDGLI